MRAAASALTLVLLAAAGSSAAGAPQAAPAPRAATENAAAAPPAEPEGVPALTNEDIVRMVASGVPEERILARIALAPALFDVAADILEELRFAGVPEPIIAAMASKARASKTEPGNPSAEPAPPARGWVEVVFEDDPKAPSAFNSILSPAEAAGPKGSLRTYPVELAFAMHCTHILHVPDHWFSLSPLGESFSRHHLLFFQKGTEPAKERKLEGLLYLPHPPAWRFEADTGIHAGLIGVAARAVGLDEKFEAWFTAPYEGLEVESGKVARIRLKMRSGPRSHSRGQGVELPDPAFVGFGTVPAQGQSFRSTLEVVSVDPPEPAPATPSPQAPAPPPAVPPPS